jgi:hypothetical protein
MKDNYFIMEYFDDVSYEACWTETHPVMFNGSKEELELEFEIIVEESINKNKYTFEFSNLKELQTRCFSYLERKKLKYNAPRFYTFEEWCLKDL